MTTILEQFILSGDNGEGDIICPLCDTEIGQFYNEGGASYIEFGLCPICNCNLNDRRGKKKWCDHCKIPCEERIELEEQWERERWEELEWEMRRDRVFFCN